jgi:predicted nucleic acid-binding protein
MRSLRRGTKLLTSNYVLSETYNWLRYREPFQTLMTTHNRIQAAQTIGLLAVKWVDRPVHDQAWETMLRYRGRRLSLCDCSSFVLCEQQAVDAVFTFDSDFRQMGFTVKP